MTFSCEKVGLEFFETAPTKYTAAQEMTATPEQIFAAFLDADAWVEWAMPITKVVWTSGFPIEVGSTRDVHMRGGIVGHEEFIAYEHGVRMAFRFNESSKEGIQAFAEDYQVTDLGGGRCRVEWVMAIRSEREGPAIVGKISGKVMNFMVGRMLRKFGRLVEASAKNPVKGQ